MHLRFDFWDQRGDCLLSCISGASVSVRDRRWIFVAAGGRMRCFRASIVWILICLWQLRLFILRSSLFSIIEVVRNNSNGSKVWGAFQETWIYERVSPALFAVDWIWRRRCSALVINVNLEAWVPRKRAECPWTKTLGCRVLSAWLTTGNDIFECMQFTFFALHQSSLD